MTTTIDGSASVTINSGAILGITSGTAVASTSGTSIDYTSIPSWVKRITVMFNGVSTNGTSVVQLQIGSGSFVTTGYAGAAFVTTANSNMSTGFLTSASPGSAANIRYGIATLTTLGSNIWIFSVVHGYSDGAYTAYGGGGLTLSGALDRVRITTVNGTDTFDAGSINIFYE